MNSVIKSIVCLILVFFILYLMYYIGYTNGRYDQKKECRWPHKDYIESHWISNSKSQHMNNYVLFQEVQTNNLIVISKNSLEYSDYETMENRGYFTRVFEGTKRECLEKQDELIPEVSTEI